MRVWLWHNASVSDWHLGGCVGPPEALLTLSVPGSALRQTDMAGSHPVFRHSRPCPSQKSNEAGFCPIRSISPSMYFSKRAIGKFHAEAMRTISKRAIADILAKRIAWRRCRGTAERSLERRRLRSYSGEFERPPLTASASAEHAARIASLAYCPDPLSTCANRVPRSLGI
jgi:hypothetical protein